ncbi:hypothetical protein QBC40DRAFT_301822 [Triangularia verruculosa]|uniref:Uncharacterized protein n=1 Tax=Triangularia verruculosa TaxID=2587418 RepID=A0AAN7AN09_9PEZI|nr:hypothetical protein QBC40DRAFT_301822 [Triangularia verruculosa]
MGLEVEWWWFEEGSAEIVKERVGGGGKKVVEEGRQACFYEELGDGRWQQPIRLGQGCCPGDLRVGSGILVSQLRQNNQSGADVAQTTWLQGERWMGEKDPSATSNDMWLLVLKLTRNVSASVALVRWLVIVIGYIESEPVDIGRFRSSMETLPRPIPIYPQDYSSSIRTVPGGQTRAWRFTAQQQLRFQAAKHGYRVTILVVLVA